MGRAVGQEFGTKQFVAVVEGRTGSHFMVFKCGNERFYLFQPIDEAGCAIGQSFPVERKRLWDDIRKALAHGWGNSWIGKPREARQRAAAEPQRQMIDGAGI